MKVSQLVVPALAFGVGAALPSTAIAQGFMPNESCSAPSPVRSPVPGDPGQASRVGVSAPQSEIRGGSTLVDVYGTAVHRLQMPSVQTGMIGLATLYTEMLKFNFSYTAWDGSG